MADIVQIRVEDSTEYKHVKWIELRLGVLSECAVMKQDEHGNLFFFELAKLDKIDKQRLFKLITNRHADQHPLWDLMAQHTLGNGMNALNYFHQLVKVITPQGQILDPRAGVIGASAGTRDIAPEADKFADEAEAAEAVAASAKTDSK